MRIAVTGVLAAVWAVGCGTRPAPDPGPPAEPAASVQIAVNVKGMTKALNIT